MLQLQQTPLPQSENESATPGLHPVSIHQMAPPVRGSKHPITAYTTQFIDLEIAFRGSYFRFLG